jgi:hypothetical protein
MIDYQRIFHTGFLVPDLGIAMQEMGASLGVTWATPWSYEPMEYWTPAGKGTAPLRVTYSKQGPQHVELIQGGGFWASQPGMGIHHVGVWTDSLAADARELMQQGWQVEAALLSPAEGFGRFCYIRPPSGGMRLELVSTEIKELMESRWV